MGALSALWGPKVKGGRKTPILNVSFVAIDTELTGLDAKKDSIISLGAIRMTGGRIDVGSSFHRLIKPQTDFKAESVVIHEITPSDVDQKPAIGSVLPEFLDFCADDVVIGYCIGIDLEFIKRELKRLHRKTFSNPVIDVYSLFECLKRRFASHTCFVSIPNGLGLYRMAKCFGIPVNGAHNALMDAYITAQLFQRFLPLLLETGFERIGDLLRVGNPSRGGDVYQSSKEVCNL
ncbi:MAG: 3'-5' exonuclease [bacterium]